MLNGTKIFTYNGGYLALTFLNISEESPSPSPSPTLKSLKKRCDDCSECFIYIDLE